MKVEIKDGTFVNIKRIVVDISEDLHTEIKMRSSFKHVSIKQWILQAIAAKIAQEERFK